MAPRFGHQSKRWDALTAIYDPVTTDGGFFGNRPSRAAGNERRIVAGNVVAADIRQNADVSLVTRMPSPHCARVAY